MREREKKWAPPDEGEWGVVVVMRGRHKGKVGYCDDDGDRAGQVVVYLEVEPFTVRRGYSVLWRKWLRRATPAEVKLYQRTAGVQSEAVARFAGIPESARRRR